MARNVPAAGIEKRIYQIRGKRVMLDRDLAELYGVETRVLNQAVRRNMKRFPADFMFSLSKEEIRRMSQIVISLKFHKNVFAFTEQGVAMLSSVLNSEQAIQVNIRIMRAFAAVKREVLTSAALKRKIDDMEKRYDSQFAAVFEAIRELISPTPAKPKREIGFHSE